jgi:hypothetical protein
MTEPSADDVAAAERIVEGFEVPETVQFLTDCAGQFRVGEASAYLHRLARDQVHIIAQALARARAEGAPASYDAAYAVGQQIGYTAGLAQGRAAGAAAMSEPPCARWHFWGLGQRCLRCGVPRPEEYVGRFANGPFAGHPAYRVREDRDEVGGVDVYGETRR